MELIRGCISDFVSLGLFQVYSFPRLSPVGLVPSKESQLLIRPLLPGGSWTPSLVFQHWEAVKMSAYLLRLLAATFCSVSHPLSAGGLQISKPLEGHSCSVSFCLSSFLNLGPSSPGCLSCPDFLFCLPGSVRMLIVLLAVTLCWLLSFLLHAS